MTRFPTLPVKILLPIVFSLVTLRAESKLEKRKPFFIPLPHMSYSYDPVEMSASVFITYEGSQEGWEIATGNDRYVKDTRKARVDHVYREYTSQISFISTFEASVLADVCDKMASTVLILEKDLQHHRWDRCLFLDAYLPNFLQRFYYLMSAAQAGFNVLPPVTRIDDSLFENSENSLKSDQRIDAWRSDTSHIVKLRIASKELAFQLQSWRSKVLLNPDRDIWDNRTEQLVSVYELFVRLYFNLPQKITPIEKN